MNVCVLNSSYERSASSFRGLDPYGDPSRFGPEHRWKCHLVEKATAVRQVRAIVQDGFDVFVNLCDGARDDDGAGIEVVQTLELLGAAFTGAGSGFYEPTRESMKRVCHAFGIRTPLWQFAKNAREARAAAGRLEFPMIVKHPNSYGSVGMGRDSRVSTVDELVRQVERVSTAYGSALIEEFIEGREFTVLVAEPPTPTELPLVLPPIEFCFPEGETFKHFDLKWSAFDGMSCHPVRDDALSRALVQAARALFHGLGGSGYGRCDLRLDERGALYMLEINPNCSIFYPEGQYGCADFILAFQPNGHRDFLEHILRCALERRRRSEKVWRLDFDEVRGYRAVATRDLLPGDTIEAHEARPHYVVGPRYVQRRWNEAQCSPFRAYAWPITDEVFMTWSEDPSEWIPMNHACDPNAWLDGLDVAARYAIQAGEPITLDYATFCGPTTTPFECACGAEHCRRMVLPEDYLAPWLVERYGEHISEYVKRMRNRKRT